MINREKLLEEEHVDKTIESLLGKITEIIIAYKLSNQDTEEASSINKIYERLGQFINMYRNESKLFEKDKETKDIQRKKLEIKIIEELGIIIKELSVYKTEINKMVEKIKHNQNINTEYDEILRVYGDYIKKSEKVTSFVHALE